MKFLTALGTIFVTVAGWSVIGQPAVGAETGIQGDQGAAGGSGADGANGVVSFFGFRCAISTNLEHLKMCLDDGRSINDPIYGGDTILQAAIESSDLPMLQLVLNNPDPKNKPDLRVKDTNVKAGQTPLNDYELLLLEGIFTSDDPIEVDQLALKDQLYVNENEVARLKILLAAENNPAAFRSETQGILAALMNSQLKATPSVQEAIAILQKGLTN